MSENPIKKGSSGLISGSIRTRIFSILGLVLLIGSLFTFLLNYQGFRNWTSIDSNLSMFVAVNVNIVLLTAAFYMVLRNLFRLLYERKRPLAGVGLKTKLIIAFVALSLPSTAFHLMASGFMAFLLETWSEGEQKQVLESAEIVLDALAEREDQLLRIQAGTIISYLPRKAADYKSGDWLNGFRPRHRGGVVVYNRENHRIIHWASGPAEVEGWHEPAAEYFSRPDGFYWKEIHKDKMLRRILLPLPNSPDQLKVEVFEVAPTRISNAERMLNQKQINNRFISRDLFFLVLSILIILTLLIIMAAAWVSVYLARGFVTPIEKLADGTRLVSEGNLGFQVATASLGPLEGDFQGLITSFNKMSGQLKEQRQQLIATTEDLRQSHNELGERNRLVELLLENIDAGILALDHLGNITALNRSAQRLIKVAEENWQGQHYRAILGREISELLDQMLESIRVMPGGVITRTLNQVHQRKTIQVEFNLLSLMNQAGTSEGVVAILKDITTEQRRQRALAWREVAKRVAHEIKNPLTPIQLSAQRIRKNVLEKFNNDPEIIDQCTSSIIGQVESMKKMVNEFSQFAKLPESEPVPDNVNHIIQEVAQSYRAGLPENISLDLELEEGLPEIPLDRDQLKRAFTNLIDNALAAIPGDSSGTITIRSMLNPETGAINLEIMDDGIGVPDHVKTRLFEPYTSTKEGGTGLGLTIVNQIISDHHGYIRYTDRKPRGSLFSIELRAG